MFYRFWRKVARRTGCQIQGLLNNGNTTIDLIAARFVVSKTMSNEACAVDT